ncbi:unnamed protein product [Sphagnum troendelagicum]|uniref:Uncharacterized protein n=1 Tax=Sphagnum troendelagicum TaxID=128251 RepID=A0ABP0TXZ3_9BRYO
MPHIQCVFLLQSNSELVFGTTISNSSSSQVDKLLLSLDFLMISNAGYRGLKQLQAIGTERWCPLRERLWQSKTNLRWGRLCNRQLTYGLTMQGHKLSMGGIDPRVVAGPSLCCTLFSNLPLQACYSKLYQCRLAWSFTVGAVLCFSYASLSLCSTDLGHTLCEMFSSNKELGAFRGLN